MHNSLPSVQASGVNIKAYREYAIQLRAPHQTLGLMNLKSFIEASEEVGYKYALELR